MIQIQSVQNKSIQVKLPTTIQMTNHNFADFAMNKISSLPEGWNCTPSRWEF